MTPVQGRNCAAALILHEGRYLMQLRDNNPAIFLPNHWASFGGGIDPGEDAAAAMVRELEEELEFHPRRIDFFTEMTVVLPLTPPRLDRMSFFAIEATAAELALMVQHEGAGRALFSPEELAREARVAPWDLAGLLMHARQAALFGG